MSEENVEVIRAAATRRNRGGRLFGAAAATPGCLEPTAGLHAGRSSREAGTPKLAASAEG